MKTLMTIKELVDEGYPRKFLFEIAHSDDFVKAGGRRMKGQKSTILFNPEKLDKYFEQYTLINH